MPSVEHLQEVRVIVFMQIPGSFGVTAAAQSRINERALGSLSRGGGQQLKGMWDLIHIMQPSSESPTSERKQKNRGAFLRAAAPFSCHLALTKHWSSLFNPTGAFGGRPSPFPPVCVHQNSGGPISPAEICHPGEASAAHLPADTMHFMFITQLLHQKCLRDHREGKLIGPDGTRRSHQNTAGKNRMCKRVSDPLG